LFKNIFDLLNEFSRRNFRCYSSSVVTAIGAFSSTQAKSHKKNPINAHLMQKKCRKMQKMQNNSKNAEKCSKMQKIHKNSNLPAS
jgi:hypothetical protein